MTVDTAALNTQWLLYLTNTATVSRQDSVPHAGVWGKPVLLLVEFDVASDAFHLALLSMVTSYDRRMSIAGPGTRLSRWIFISGLKKPTEYGVHTHTGGVTLSSTASPSPNIDCPASPGPKSEETFNTNKSLYPALWVWNTIIAY